MSLLLKKTVGFNHNSMLNPDKIFNQHNWMTWPKQTPVLHTTTFIDYVWLIQVFNHKCIHWSVGNQQGSSMKIIKCHLALSSGAEIMLANPIQCMTANAQYLFVWPLYQQECYWISPLCPSNGFQIHVPFYVYLSHEQINTRGTNKYMDDK